MDMEIKELRNLAEKVITCRKCERLVNYLREVSSKKVRRFIDWDYWGKPLPSFGDPNAELLIVGLAPAAHGGNRTGRMFTGDSSGDWLIRALYETGFANQLISKHKNDGLVLRNAYITAAVRCAPPNNKPTSQEITTCNQYLVEELKLLHNLKIILALGRIAFRAVLMAFKNGFSKILKPRPRFFHGAEYIIDTDDRIFTLIASYHPSRQNTQTGRLKWEDWLKIFEKIKLKLENGGV